MDKIIIVGGYEFLSYHLCKHFLEQGNLVECISIENRDDLFLDEKRLSVGRNSNLVEISLSEWSDAGFACGPESLVIVSLYDLFLKKDGERMLAQLETAASELESVELFKPAEAIILQPLQVQQDETNQCNRLASLGEKLAKMINEKGITNHKVSLPTIYGPWQPVEFSFQQAFYHQVKNREEFQINPYEWIYDAIYIDDVVSELARLIQARNIKSCVFKNKSAEKWKKCAEFLGINPIFYDNNQIRDIVDSNECFNEIVETIDIEKGLTLQKEHLMRILSGV